MVCAWGRWAIGDPLYSLMLESLIIILPLRIACEAKLNTIMKSPIARKQEKNNTSNWRSIERSFMIFTVILVFAFTLKPPEAPTRVLY